MCVYRTECKSECAMCNECVTKLLHFTSKNEDLPDGFLTMSRWLEYCDEYMTLSSKECLEMG